ncbi:hypothetical protein ACEUCS_06410 [Aeromonas caviae]|uniref:hypothetical protein n=1 Tax=Aeromonas caviae TaxID=648 RepID=UPI0038D00304
MTAAVVNATAFTNEHFPRLLAQLKSMGDRAHFDSEQSELYLQFIEQLHIPADHEHQFRFNVNTISGPM